MPEKVEKFGQIWPKMANNGHDLITLNLMQVP